ncbi:MAG: Serine/threonine protein kinase [Marmoricola sp.]|nr:Serine/threonine protein kinase [Marmoricola sp.]
MSLPESLGRLRRVERIGAGGFATVWLYHDNELDSDVAVKALADNWSQRLDVRDRFLEEARILRRADSDHVVRVYDIGEADGTPYFVMTYADLGSIAARLENDPQPSLEEIVNLISQAGEGLAVLHAQGVIHRDVKPHNLLLRSNGNGVPRLLVADLGVAKAMLQASGLTQVVGTPAYMAPEQATGIGLSTRADTHALAAVAYRMLTGRTVRDDGLAGLIDPVAPPPPSSLADVPPAMDDVLLRALAPDPADRWPDIEAFTRALAAAADPEHTLLAPRMVSTSSTTGGRATTGGRSTTGGPRAVVDSASKTPDLVSSGPTRSGRPLLLALGVLVMLAVTFGIAYAVTTQLR